MIIFENVYKKSKRNIFVNNESGKERNLLSNVNFEIEKGEFVYITGKSGSGKTSILKMIYRERKPTSGNIYINGKNVVKMKEKEIPLLRRKLGIVFQDFKLFEKRTVYKNIAFALEVIGTGRKEIGERVESVLKFIGLIEKKDEVVSHLSAGEKQRVAIARAVINSPEILICDEITANLNPEMAYGILKLLLELNALGTTIIFATHDKAILDKYPKRVIVMDKGEIIDDNRIG